MTAAIPNPQLRLLNALRANSKPIMTFLGLPSFRTGQIIAQTGVDVSASQLLHLNFALTVTRVSSSIASMEILATIQCTPQLPLSLLWGYHHLFV